ncbi:hypothetical protein AB6A40_011428 [Gnathostoma spinigerum]|uniref:COP9 signalosome complex subunit 3 N-terminal helical repeats domain-containing protein n=1 Tax=Gnathostoma spinigerum TaxID=75299 RepID=A0ABD6EXL8_9BILA
MSVDCPLDNYVKRILDFAKYGQGDAKELLEYNRRAVADVLERNADNLDRVLEALCSPCYTISIISVLLAKMQQPTLPTNTEKIEATLIQVENMLNIFDRESILKAIDLYIALFRRILQYFLRPECKVIFQCCPRY